MDPPFTPSYPPDPPELSVDQGRVSGRSAGPILWFILVTLVAIFALRSWLSAPEEGSRAVRPTEGPAQAATGGGPSPDHPIDSRDTGRADPGSRRIPRAGTYSVTFAGSPFSFSVPAGGWELYDDLHITRDTVGPQGAEAIIYWTSIVDGPARPCGQWWGSPAGFVGDFAASASMARGIDLLTGPVDALVGGLPAKYVVFEVRDEVAACQPGFFYTWRDIKGSAFWPGVDVGDTIRIWILDVDGTRLYIEAATRPETGPLLEREIQRIIGSIRFD